MSDIFMPLRRYAQFSGRARRGEFWRWILLLTAIWMLILRIDRPLYRFAVALPASDQIDFTSIFALSEMGFVLAMLTPTLAVTMRRLHDTGARGVWALLTWAPVMVSLALFSAHHNETGDMATYTAMFGSLLVLAWCALPGTTGENRYGADPLDNGMDQLAATFE